MSLSAATPRRRLRGPARRAVILRHAVAAFAANGYGPTSMGEIADQVGVTRAVLYDHFPSKKALYLAALGEQSALFVGHVGAAIGAQAAPRERMIRTMDAVFGFADAYPDAWRLLFVNSRNGEAEVDQAWRESWDSRVSGVVELLEDDLARGGLAGHQQRILVEMLVGALTAAVEHGRQHRGVTRDDLVDAGTALLWVGLRNTSRVASGT